MALLSVCSINHLSPTGRPALTRCGGPSISRFSPNADDSRYWVAEHHGTQMLACASPEALIGPIAASTSRHTGRERRRHAAALQPAQGRRNLQHAERHFS